MIIAFWAAVAKVAKKALAILLGDKKARKFLGYVVGIALFIVLLPFIAVYGLFGWMSGGEAIELISYEDIYEQLPSEYREEFEANEAQLSEIERVFTENGLTQTDISKAKTIYLSCLIGKESEDGFYQKYADCFLADGEETDLLNSIASAFGVTFSDEDRQQFENLYGGS